MKVKLSLKDALIVVDMQRDFMPGGALPVPEGDKIIPRLNQYTRLFSSLGLPVFFTRDWHPPDHISFKEQGGVWPPHCVQNTEGVLIFLPDPCYIYFPNRCKLRRCPYYKPFLISWWP